MIGEATSKINEQNVSNLQEMNPISRFTSLKWFFLEHVKM